MPENQGPLWLHGRHAVAAALANPAREVLALEAAREADLALAGPRGVPARRVDRRLLDRRFGASHQGLALEVRPLPAPDLARIAERRLLLLDRVADPRNLGALLRSAEAFGVDAVVATRDGAPGETGALARAAAGALERVPVARVVNLARTMERLARERGFWFLALAPDAGETIASVDLAAPIGLVLGGEGAGLRRLVRERCDFEARIPLARGVDSLNVAVAAGIALHEVVRREA